MISKDYKIRVMFINKNSYLDKYFSNFENLYYECIIEWTRGTCIDMEIVNNFDLIDFDNIALHVILD